MSNEQVTVTPDIPNLLRCPLCEGAALISSVRATETHAWSMVECVRCGLEISKPSREKAVAAWNTRLSTQSPSSDIEAEPLERAREAFLNLVADADKWEEQVDGDADEYGRPVMTVDYVIHTGHSQLAELVDALGIPGSRYMETLKDRIDRAVQS